MKPKIDSDGREWFVMSEDELHISFLAQCIELLAESTGENYLDIFNRLEKANLTKEFILKHYESLHSQSIEAVIEDILMALHNREKITHMDNAEKDMNMILTADTTGIIACMIAKETGQTPLEAFKNFIKSYTYSLFRNPRCYMNNWGPAPIVKEYLREINNIHDLRDINFIQ